MSVKVGINGFGRIGSLAFSASFDKEDVEVVEISQWIERAYYFD